MGLMSNRLSIVIFSTISVVSKPIVEGGWSPFVVTPIIVTTLTKIIYLLFLLILN